MRKLPLWVVGFVGCGAGFLSACGSTEADPGQGGSCPAYLSRLGENFRADSRFGVPAQEGQALSDVRSIDCEGSGEHRVSAFVIPGISPRVAFYAPDAFGPEFIMIKGDMKLTKDQRELLEPTGVADSEG